MNIVNRYTLIVISKLSSLLYVVVKKEFSQEK